MSRVLRPIRVDGCVAFVTLTRGHVAIIDTADIPLIEGFNWSAAYGGRGSFYAKRNERGKIIYMHREIMGASDLHVDHVDGNGLNNRRENLREATFMENNRNRTNLNRNNRSGIRGVSWDSSRGLWAASITIDRKAIGLGRFKTLDAAAAVRAAAEREHFGDFGASR